MLPIHPRQFSVPLVPKTTPIPPPSFAIPVPAPRFPIPAPILVCCLYLAVCCRPLAAGEASDFADLLSPANSYWTRNLEDPFSKLIDDLEAGKVPLDYKDEKAFVTSLLKTLAIPASSQMWVFSTTSLQLSKISPRNPRALYFNDNLYLGYIPGGKIEIISLDPHLGGIFYIFPIPEDGGPPQPERSRRCMNCHANSDTRHVPGLAIKSVIPGPNGGSLNSFRRGQTGHQIPLVQRFGGWHITGGETLGEHWGNLLGRLSRKGLSKREIQPGELFDLDRYPVPTSDVLPQLLHEHQAGFVNRVVEAAYKYRSYLHEGEGRLSPAHTAEMEKVTKSLTRYILFADEAPLPAGGIEGDAQYKKDFLSMRKTLSSGESLRDFDLQTRLFKHRCSYMVHSTVFQGLPPGYKSQLLQSLARALDTQSPDPEYAYLSDREKKTINKLLATTLSK